MATPAHGSTPCASLRTCPKETASLIAEASFELPGVSVAVEARRQYAQGPLFSQILGYTGPVSAEQIEALKPEGYLPDDLIGKTGLEAYYEEDLRGAYGSESVEKDASGRSLQVLETISQAEAGNSLRLTIDTREQKLAQQALEWGMKEAGVKRGVVIVMNPQTGEVLAMVSLPTYDDNLFARGISAKDFAALLANPDKPLLNHAVSAHYPPGSTYKLVAGTGALADGKVTSQHSHPDAAVPHARLVRVLGLEPPRLRSAATSRLRLRPLERHVLLPARRASSASTGSASGPISTASGSRPASTCPARSGASSRRTSGSSRRWARRSSLARSTRPASARATTSVTPIQLINAYAALANGGKLYEPQLVREVDRT